MAEKEKITEETLNSILDKELKDSIGVTEETLASKQGDAIARYLGKEYGTEVEGRSHYVSRDVMDTIEWIMPTLMDIYYSTDTPVNVEPQNQKDIEGAEQETQYLSYVLNRKNPGFLLIHNFVKDGLLQKIGILKHWWDESKKAKEAVYEGLTQDELEALLSDEDTELLEHTVYLDGEELDEAVDDPDAKHDVRVSHSQGSGKVVIENVPQEEFRISKRGTRKDNTNYMSHVTLKTVSELIDMGFDRKTIENLALDHATNEGSEKANSPQFIERHDQDSTDPQEYVSDRTDLAMRELELEEHYIRIDWNDDGVAEIRQIFRIDKEILENDEIAAYPFTFWSPILMPHKLIGLSIVDLVEDLQKIKTHLTRAMLDNVNNANNGGFTVLQGMVNMEDMMATGPLRIIRQRVPNAVQRLDSPGLPQEAFQMLGYIDKVREERTGVNAMQQGMDDKVLGSNTAAMAVTQMMTAAMQRIQLIARVLAETGLKDLYMNIHRIASQHVEKEEIFRLQEDFVTVNPGEWHDRTDFTVNVGTGHANKDQKLLHLNMLSQDLAQIIGGGGLDSIVTGQNVYELMKEKFLAAGFKGYSKFITDPSQQQDQGPSEEEQMQKAILKQDMQLKERQMQKEEAEVNVAKAEAMIKQGEAQVAAVKARAEIAKIQHDMQMQGIEIDIELVKLDQAEQELEIEREQKRGVKIG